MDKYYMYKAMLEAEKAAANNDVPVGAVIVRDEKIIGRGYNQVEKKGDSTAHAELIAIRQAIRKTGHKHLLDCTMYVTLEPCSMCAGAIVLARIPRLVIGTSDPKTGACGSITNIVQNEKLNHRCELTTGVLEKENAAMLKDFFKKLRASKTK